MEQINGVLEIEKIGGEWVHIRWLDPGRFKVKAVKAVRQIEEEILRSGRKGWIMTSERAHITMHKIIHKMGGTVYASDFNVLHFKKEIN